MDDLQSYSAVVPDLQELGFDDPAPSIDEWDVDVTTFKFCPSFIPPPSPPPPPVVEPPPPHPHVVDFPLLAPKPMIDLEEESYLPEEIGESLKSIIDVIKQGHLSNTDLNCLKRVITVAVKQQTLLSNCDKYVIDGLEACWTKERGMMMAGTDFVNLSLIIYGLHIDQINQESFQCMKYVLKKETVVEMKNVHRHEIISKHFGVEIRLALSKERHYLKVQPMIKFQYEDRQGVWKWFECSAVPFNNLYPESRMPRKRKQGV